MNLKVTFAEDLIAKTKFILGNTNLCDSSSTRNFYYDICDFKIYNGRTIIENSSYGLHRNFSFLDRLCRTTKINVLVGTGLSTTAIKSKKSDFIYKRKKEIIYNVMRKNLEETFFSFNYRKNKFAFIGIKAAFIGEVGSDWPISAFARNSIVATGELQKQLRCPVSFTPVFNSDAVTEVLRIYQEAGGNAKKAIVSHVDCIFSDKTKFLEFVSDNDCYVQFSLFGFDSSIYPDTDCTVLSDAQRVRRITIMKEEKLLHRVLMSHDIHTKNRLLSCGGHGYSFILKHILPYMKRREFTDDELHELMIFNPMRWLKRD